MYRAAFGAPSVLLTGSRWWAHAASGPAGTVPALSSVDLLHWEREGDVLPTPGPWAVPGPVGSPEVIELGPDRFALFYTAVCAAHRTPAIGVAVASSPAGPFRDGPGAGPLVCRPGRGGARAAGILVEPDASLTLTWTDGDGSRICARPLGHEGTVLRGAEVPGTDPTHHSADTADTPDIVLLAASLPWQDGSVGDARAIRTADGPVLLYSAGAADRGGRLLGLARGRADAHSHADIGVDADGGDGVNAGDPDSPRFHPDPHPLLGSRNAAGGPFGSPGRGAPVRHPDGTWWLLFDAPASDPRGVTGHQPLLWLTGLDPGPGTRGDGATDGGAIDNGANGEIDNRAIGDGVPAAGSVENTPSPAPLPVPAGRWRLPLPADPTPDQERVLRSFVVHGAIRALPAHHARRVVLLDLLAQLFEPGFRYPEPEVDRRLTGIWAPGVHPDYARLRRLLVDEGFLDRRGGIYRRSGGTV